MTARPRNALVPVAVSEGGGENVVRFETGPQTELEVDEKLQQEMRTIWASGTGYGVWRTTMIDRIEPGANMLPLDKQYEYQIDFTQRQHEALREENPDLFRAGLSRDTMINEIKSGYSAALGDFTMDDWFAGMGDRWESWLSLNVYDTAGTATRQYVYEQAALRELL